MGFGFIFGLTRDSEDCACLVVWIGNGGTRMMVVRVYQQEYLGSASQGTFSGSF